MASAAPRRRLVIVLFAIYLLMLIGLVLFKYPFNYVTSGSGRELNLIPLAGSLNAQGRVQWSEVVENVLVFIPYGVYVALLKRNWSFGRQLLPILITSIAFETIQYIFAIGRSDITDVLGNTIGGAIGIGVCAALARIPGFRTNRVLTVAALILTGVAVLAWAFFALHSAGGDLRTTGEMLPL